MVHAAAETRTPRTPRRRPRRPAAWARAGAVNAPTIAAIAETVGLGGHTNELERAS